MSLLASVLLVFIVCLTLQIVLFRICNPKKPFFWLGIIFLSGLSLAICFHFNSWSVVRISHFSIFYLMLFGNYLITFLNTREPGPSFLMLDYLEAYGQCRREDFNKVVSRTSIWHQRLNEMILSRIVILKNGRYEITPYGVKYLWFYTFYRRILGARYRGG